MTIEKITDVTAEQAGYIYTMSWKTGYQGIVPQDYLDHLSHENWSPRLGRSSFEDFILNDRGIYIATSSVSPARDTQMPGWGEIISLYVLPAYFGMGYGKTLFSYVKAHLQEQGFDRIYLWVLEENIRARQFYEKMGLHPNGDHITENI